MILHKEVAFSYFVARGIGSNIFINHHSIWETPTGSMVDVKLDELVVFLPVKYLDASKEWYDTNALFEFSTERNVVLSNPIGEEWIVKQRNWLQNVNLEWGLIHHRKYQRYEDKEYQEYLDDYYEDLMEVA